MLDIERIRKEPEWLDEGLKKRGLEPLSDKILKLDAERRVAQTVTQQLEQRRNQMSKEIGVLKAQGQDARHLMHDVNVLKDHIVSNQLEEQKIATELQTILMSYPNIPANEVIVGKDEKANVELSRVGEPPKFQFNDIKDHVALGELNKQIDFETAAKLSGARFVVLKGPIARMERALAQMMLDTHTQEFGYTEVSPPLMVLDNAMFGTGQLPKFSADLFKTEYPVSEDLSLDLQLEDDNRLKEFLNQRPELKGTIIKKIIKSDGETEKCYRAYKKHWLIPTAEVSLTNFVNDTILDPKELPMRLTAFTPCFRSEAGSAGRDTRGMIRQHQFYKVEMVSITTPEQSAEEHERMTKAAETILQKLKLPYRKIMLCTGDMGFSAQKTYDLEVWIPSQNTYREISSCSNCGDFQARRMKARYKPEGSNKTEFVHTLNGSGLAVGRALVAVIENYQQQDGSIIVPEVLRPYMGGLEVIKP